MGREAWILRLTTVRIRQSFFLSARPFVSFISSSICFPGGGLDVDF
jgi:hypothetical protein